MSRDTLLIDEPLELVASGCEPGTTVEIAATMETINKRDHALVGGAGRAGRR